MIEMQAKSDLRESPSHRASRPVLWLTVGFIVFWSVVPIVWLAVMAVQPEVNYTGQPMNLRVGDTSAGWLGNVVGDGDYRASVANSIVVSVAVMLITVGVGSFAGYSLARLPVPAKRTFLAVVIASRILPSMLLLVPMFLVARRLHLLDSIWVLIIVYSALLLPFATWLLRNFFLQLAPDLERAARMDGCSTTGVLLRVVLPVAAPGVATTAIFCFIESWNSFLFALVLTRGNAKPVTALLAERSNSANYGFELTVSDLAAGGVLAVVPVTVLVMFLHKHVVRGIIPSVKA